MATEYKNILINALVNLGDVVLTTAACDLIKQHFFNTKITMPIKTSESPNQQFKGVENFGY